MENINLPPIPEDEKNKIDPQETTDEAKEQPAVQESTEEVEHDEENIGLPPIPEEVQDKVDVQASENTQEEPSQKPSVKELVSLLIQNDQQQVTSYICIAIGFLAFLLRGLAIYSVLCSILVFFFSAGDVIASLVTYRKNKLASLIALIVSISACGSCLSLLASFVADALFAPKQEVYEQDLSDIFGNEFTDPFNQFGENQEDGSDYFWD
ncbi:MAG: hypothetical protein KBT48_00835 [Firmicutes bacterium]|nr:hypothetical protein [Bacillota bacterium]